MSATNTPPPSCCKDYFLEKVLYMYQGSVEESVLILLWLYEPAIYIEVCHQGSFLKEYISFADEAISNT